MLRIPRILPYRALARSLSQCSFAAGDKIHGYQVQRAVEVPEFSLNAIELEHMKTGSKHIHLERDDSNNVFNVLVRTVPKNDTGIAHILEHVVLCGSEMYPVRDPFFKMMDRSMATFMNAMTGSDFTMYPFSTQNSKDYQNLMSVYLNAVFFPRIRKVDFLQEGWRLEHEVVEDKKSPIIFKGVVFNEMKGYMGNSDYLITEALQKNLLPDHTYGYSSGGEPIAIPQLSWEELKQFHHDHFHPSNAVFMTYGDMPLENHLEMIDRDVMKRFSEITPDTQIPAQQRWTEPQFKVVTSPPDKMAANPDKQSAFSVSYLLPEICDVYETFVASVVAALLTDGPTAPLYKSLVESGVGSSYSPMTGYFGRLREGVFSCGLQGIAEKDHGWVENTIYETIQNAAENGYAKERVDALLHQIELDMSHQRSQFGLGLTFSILPVWAHGADPFTSIQVKDTLKKFRKNLRADKEYLQKKTAELFLGNDHRLGLLMKVDEKYKEKIELTERGLLAERVEALNKKDRKNIFKQGLELQKLQNEVEDLSCLPGIALSDIPRRPQRYEAVRSVHRAAPVYLNEQPTNGVSYFNAIVPVNGLDEELYSYLPLFCECLTEMGTQDEDYESFAQRQEMYTGGLSASMSIQSHYNDVMKHEAAIHLNSHALDRNTGQMFAMWKDLWQGFSFGNHTRLQTLLSQRAQRLANGLSFSGHAYAMKNAAQGLAPSAYLSELCNGVSQINFIKDLSASPDIEKTARILQQIGDHVFNSSSSSPRYAINVSPQHTPTILRHLNSFIETVDATPPPSDFSWKVGGIDLPFTKRNDIDLPLAVNFISTCCKTVPYSHADNPSLRVLARLMSTKFLHREIREKGGAYGSGASQGSDGVWKFYSYRDPNVDKTLDTFQHGVKWAVDGKFTQEEMNEAKVAMFQSIDSPVAPSSRGLSYFSSELDNEIIQSHRERLLDVTREQLIEAATTYLLNKGSSSSSTVIGPTSNGSAADA